MMCFHNEVKTFRERIINVPEFKLKSLHLKEFHRFQFGSNLNPILQKRFISSIPINDCERNPDPKWQNTFRDLCDNKFLFSGTMPRFYTRISRSSADSSSNDRISSYHTHRYFFKAKEFSNNPAIETIQKHLITVQSAVGASQATLRFRPRLIGRLEKVTQCQAPPTTAKLRFPSFLRVLLNWSRF
jgi:hypothetical protein